MKRGGSPHKGERAGCHQPDGRDDRYLGAVLILVVSVLKGSISVGAFAAVYYALNSLFDMVFALVCGFLGSAVGSLPAVENYVAFLEKIRQELEGRAADGEGDAVFGCFCLPIPAQRSLRLSI